MVQRSHTFGIDEYYHCYNRGIEKRNVFQDAQDYSYFLKSLQAYNSKDIFGKLRLYSERNNLSESDKPVEILAYCLLPNHFHLILRERTEHGISNFMKRVGVGYTMYFNKKNKRVGSLFQGTYKSKHIQSDQDLRQVIAYVGYNNQVHNISDPALYRSGLNQKNELVRGLTSNLNGKVKLLEVVRIIKDQRLSFDM